MNAQIATRIGVALLATCLAGSGYAHHSTATHYDASKTHEITGVVAEFQFVSPHSVIFVDVQNDDGSVERWEVEGGSANSLRRQGWDKNTFRPGDVITVSGSPHRRDIPQMVGREFNRADGAISGENRRPSSAELAAIYPPDPSARGISGRWLPPQRGEDPDRSPDRERPPGSPLPLTQAGLEAWERYDPEHSPVITCEPMNVPTLFYVSYMLDIRVDDRQALIHHELYDVTRRVPFNAEPALQEPSGAFARATARMEGNELVIESSGYAPSNWGLAVAVLPNGNGGDVPSSAQKRVTERYSVSDDGQKLRVDYTVEDPIYLTEPFSARREWTRLADDAPLLFEFNCDPASAARFTGLALEDRIRDERE